MSDFNTRTRDNSVGTTGEAAVSPIFQEPSDYAVGQHVVFHHFDGKDYEGVITDVWGPGSDVANRWVVHLDVGKIGKLHNITESGREEPQNEGTFSLKPKADPETKDDPLVRNLGAGRELPTRPDLNPRPRPELDGSAGAPQHSMEEFAQSAAPSDVPEEDHEANPFEEIRDDQWHQEHDAENPGDEGLKTPADEITDNRDSRGEELPPPDADELNKVGTTQSDDDEHVVAKKRSTK